MFILVTRIGSLVPACEDGVVQRGAPVGNRSADAALAELSQRDLVQLFRESQPAWTAPESAYGAR